MTYWDRWPKEKQDQIKQLIAYAEMCGLSGKDLVSLGNHLDRQLVMSTTQSLVSLVHTMPIALLDGDKTRPWYEQKWWNVPWSIIAPNGFCYSVSHGDFMRFRCESETGVTHQVTSYGYYQWPRHWGWRKRHSYSFVLDIENGTIKLDW